MLRKLDEVNGFLEDLILESKCMRDKQLKKLLLISYKEQEAKHNVTARRG